MWQKLKALFEGEDGSAPVDPQRRLQLATAALLVEVQRADHELDAAERAVIADLLQRRFGLAPAEADELLADAAAEADATVSLHAYTQLLKAHLDAEARKRLLAMLWEAAYADGELHMNEEGLVRKVAELLYVPHRDFIATKLAAGNGAADSDAGV